MAYEKQNFTPGQKLKAEHLNHIEEGIEDLEQRMTSEGGYELLWRNPQTTLGQERIEIPNLMDYDRIEIVHVTDENDVVTNTFPVRLLERYNGTLITFYDGALANRSFYFGVDAIEFYDGYLLDIRTGGSIAEYMACAPVEIYGIKEGGL